MYEVLDHIRKLEFNIFIRIDLKQFLNTDTLESFLKNASKCFEHAAGLGNYIFVEKP